MLPFSLGLKTVQLFTYDKARDISSQEFTHYTNCSQKKNTGNINIIAITIIMSLFVFKSFPIIYCIIAFLKPYHFRMLTKKHMQ